MIIEVRALALLNALLPIEVRALPDAKVTVLRAVVPENAESPIEVTLFGIVIEVREFALFNAYLPIEVTPFGTDAPPRHPVFPVTTLSVIVKVPPALQFTGPFSKLLTIVKPFHVGPSSKPVASLPMLATAPVTLLKATPLAIGALPSKFTDASAVALLNA